MDGDINDDSQESVRGRGESKAVNVHKKKF